MAALQYTPSGSILPHSGFNSIVDKSNQDNNLDFDADIDIDVDPMEIQEGENNSFDSFGREWSIDPEEDAEWDAVLHHCPDPASTSENPPELVTSGPSQPSSNNDLDHIPQSDLELGLARGPHHETNLELDLSTNQEPNQDVQLLDSVFEDFEQEANLGDQDVEVQAVVDLEPEHDVDMYHEIDSDPHQQNDITDETWLEDEPPAVDGELIFDKITSDANGHVTEPAHLSSDLIVTESKPVSKSDQQTMPHGTADPQGDAAQAVAESSIQEESSTMPIYYDSLVHYDGQQLSLFPPSSPELPETYLLQDSVLATKTLDHVFVACRQILGDSISEHEVLEFHMADLDFRIDEDSKDCERCSLSHMLDAYHRHSAAFSDRVPVIVLRAKLRLSARLLKLMTSNPQNSGNRDKETELLEEHEVHSRSEELEEQSHEEQLIEQRHGEQLEDQGNDKQLTDQGYNEQLTDQPANNMADQDYDLGHAEEYNQQDELEEVIDELDFDLDVSHIPEDVGMPDSLHLESALAENAIAVTSGRNSPEEISPPHTTDFVNANPTFSEDDLDAIGDTAPSRGSVASSITVQGDLIAVSESDVSLVGVLSDNQPLSLDEEQTVMVAPSNEGIVEAGHPIQHITLLTPNVQSSSPSISVENTPVNATVVNMEDLKQTTVDIKREGLPKVNEEENKGAKRSEAIDFDNWLDDDEDEDDDDVDKAEILNKQPTASLSRLENKDDVNIDLLLDDDDDDDDGDLGFEIKPASPLGKRRFDEHTEGVEGHGVDQDTKRFKLAEAEAEAKAIEAEAEAEVEADLEAGLEAKAVENS